MRELRKLAACAAALAVVTLPARPARAQQADPLAGFDAWVGKALADFGVPGAAVAVVRGDSVILARGYGVRTLGRAEPVTERTIFAIGSASKAFTATLVGMLVDEGKVSWDDPVTKHLAGFQLYDPYVTRELRVRDALSHRSGLARGDLLWYSSALTRDEVLQRVRYLRPTWSLRSNFGYQNIMYLAAGQVASRAGGKGWDDLVRERLFAPLGMTASNTSTGALAELADLATPHTRVDDTVRTVSYRNIDNAGPAGSINSNVVDMAKWVRFQLDSGRVGGKSLITTSSFVETHTPHTVIRRSPQGRALNPFTHFQSYGLGWFLEDYRGRELVHHGGNIDGMSALVALMPGERLGLVVLTNMNATSLPAALMRELLDRHLGATGKDWIADVLKATRAQEAQAKAREERERAARVRNTSPTLALARYAGTYYDSLYGEAKVTLDGKRLVLATGPASVADLEHWHYDTFRARWRERARGSTLVGFTLDTQGKVSGVRPAQGPGAIPEEAPDYRRVADPADTIPKVQVAAAEMERLAGVWESRTPPLTVQVEMVAGSLRLTVPGQPVYTLVPETPTRFRLTGPPGMPPGSHVRYDVEGGTARRMTLVQPAPQPTLTFVRKS